MHEHLDKYGIINMNGRLYDPKLGRFIQPDPYVVQPDNLQSFNAYAYCLNNPLKYTDPDGEVVFLVPIIVGALVGAYIGGSMANGTQDPRKWNYQDGKTWRYMGIGAAVGGVSGYAGAQVMAWGGGTMLAGAASGFVGGAGFAGLQSGWNPEAMAMGGVIGAYSGAIGGLYAANIGGYAGAFWGGVMADVVAQGLYTGSVDPTQALTAGAIGLGFYGISRGISNYKAQKNVWTGKDPAKGRSQFAVINRAKVSTAKATAKFATDRKTTRYIDVTEKNSRYKNYKIQGSAKEYMKNLEKAYDSKFVINKKGDVLVMYTKEGGKFVYRQKSDSGFDYNLDYYRPGSKDINVKLRFFRP